uniref:Uncharacterized protein n=1 Tax=Noctiluca scintillans TaxID=2966 RepID=A0A7S1A488_NOCSC
MAGEIQWEWTDKTLLTAASPFRRSRKGNALQTTHNLKEHKHKGQDYPVTIHVHDEPEKPETSFQFPDVGSVIVALEVRVMHETRALHMVSINSALESTSLTVDNLQAMLDQSADSIDGAVTSAEDVSRVYGDAERAFIEATQLARDAQKIADELQNVLEGAHTDTIARDGLLLDKTIRDAKATIRDAQKVAADAKVIMDDMQSAGSKLTKFIKLLTG